MKVREMDKVSTLESAGKELTPKQIIAIKRSIRLGRQLQRDLPEIADDYRFGLSRSQIALKYNICLIYDVGGSVAIGGVYNAIIGSAGLFSEKPYNGLIEDPSEAERLGLEHMIERGRIAGHTTHEQGLGIHARKPEQMSIDGRKGGRISGRITGRTTHEQGLGIHAQTPEEKREIGRKGGHTTHEQGLGIYARTPEQMSIDGTKGGQASAKSKGLVPFGEDELNDAYQLSQLPEYQKREYQKNRINNELLAQELNRKYHEGKPIRTNRVVRNVLTKFRKKLSNQSSEHF
jgi:general stress protein YciG